MSFVVKWVPKGRGDAVSSPQRYGTRSEALAFACAALAWMPERIWLEDERGGLVLDHRQVIAHAAAMSPPNRGPLR